jgi:hypothetical protein
MIPSMSGNVRKKTSKVNCVGDALRRMQFQRDAPYGAHVVGDVIAGLAVAAGGGVGEFSVAIEQGDGYAVDLGFDGDRDVVALEVLLEAAIEIDELLLGAGGSGFFDRLGAELEDVVDAEHGDGVLDLLEALDGCATDAEGGRVRLVELWVFGFEGFEFAEETVVFRVGDFRLGLAVIEPVVTVELDAQFADPVLRERGLGEKVRLGHGRSLRPEVEFSRAESAGKRHGISTGWIFFWVKRTTT